VLSVFYDRSWKQVTEARNVSAIGRLVVVRMSLVVIDRLRRVISLSFATLKLLPSVMNPKTVVISLPAF
jgi:hypothetical protein